MQYTDILSRANFRTKLIKVVADSGTYEVSEGVTFIQLFMAGGGGGGSAGYFGTGTDYSGSGGGAGGCVKGMIFSPPPGTVFNWSVGAGGSGGSGATATAPGSGTDGGDTTFESSGIISVTCTGGKGGVAPSGSAAVGGSKGGVRISDISDWELGNYSWAQGIPRHLFRVGSGGNGGTIISVDPTPAGNGEYYFKGEYVTVYPGGTYVPSSSFGAPGGASLYGAGGPSNFSIAASLRNGTGNGSGGAGGASTGAGSTYRTAGDGTPGLIIVQEYYNVDPSDLFAITNY